MKSKSLTQTVLNATDNLLSSVSDSVLLTLYFILASTGRHTGGQIDRAIAESYEMLSDVNTKTIRNSLYALIKHGLIIRNSQNLSLSSKGKTRCLNVVPHYQKERPWNGEIFLISYDIPANANKARNMLRSYLKRLKCGMLQESLWFSVADPTSDIARYVSENQLPGQILVSRLGKDGAIGQEKLSDIVKRIYNLDELANKYLGFINKYRYGGVRSINIALAYLAILKTDPQLPFELEPVDFPARQANKIYLRMCRKLV